MQKVQMPAMIGFNILPSHNTRNMHHRRHEQAALHNAVTRLFE
jgi:hypothetical protein